MNNDTKPSFRWVSDAECEARYGKSIATLTRWSELGLFPKKYQLGPRTSARRSDELDAFDASRQHSTIPSPRKARKAASTAESATPP